MADLADQDDVEARLGRPLTTEETSRIDGLLEESAALVTGWLGHTPDPVPAAVRIVVSRMAARALTATGEPGLTNLSATMGPFGVTRAFSADSATGGVRLTRPDKVMLRPFTRRGMAGNVAT